jgi:nucleotide-binding universal stress UspA family protein
MITTVLTAYDASAQAEKAFDFAVGIAARFGAELVACAVATLPEPPVDVEATSILDHAAEFYGKRVDGLARRAAAAGVSLRFEIKVGHPAEQIILLAEAEKAQLIVMGHRGNTIFQKWMVGSVCRQVINQAPCSVTVVR